LPVQHAAALNHDPTDSPSDSLPRALLMHLAPITHQPVGTRGTLRLSSQGANPPLRIDPLCLPPLYPCLTVQTFVQVVFQMSYQNHSQIRRDHLSDTRRNLARHVATPCHSCSKTSVNQKRDHCFCDSSYGVLVSPASWIQGRSVGPTNRPRGSRPINTAS
jgi:hypothetical protein